jgi:catechol 2,3-dioxygenase-like lactoylglutathione lyase family enzyme
MTHRLEHVAIYCKDINESIEFYRTHFGGQPTSIRKGSAGYAFCFVTIDGAPSIQLMESPDKVGVHHYGFISDDIEQAAKDFKEKNARILRENRDPSGKLTTIFVQDPHGLEMEIRSAR